jgi:hypothetical protein
MHSEGNQLLEQVEAGAGDAVAHRLLQQFFSGYPVDNLRRLLESNAEHAVRVGAWIASELGARALPLLQNIAPLLHHRSRYVRFFLLDPVLVCAGHEDGPILASAVGLLRDVDDAVRWKALQFITRATSQQLASSIAFQGDSQLAQLTEWLVNLDGHPDKSGEIEERLNADASIDRLFAAAAAVRNAQYDLAPLRRAAASLDNDVKSFAEEQLRVQG